MPLPHISEIELPPRIFPCSKDRTLTNWLLSEDLDDYAEVVDDRNGLNNYAEYISSLCSKALKPATGTCSDITT